MKNRRDTARAVPPGMVDWFVHEIDANRPGLPDWQSASLDPSRSGQLERIQRLWNALGSAEAAERLGQEPRSELLEGSPAYQQWLASGAAHQPAVPPLARRVSRQWALAASLVTLLMVGGLYSLFSSPQAHVETYSTGTAQIQRVNLPDGSQVILGAQTQLSVRYTRERRAISLQRGEALFSVIHNSIRPFVVSAGAGSITAIGTRFDVAREVESRSDRVTVVVNDGTVEVAPPGSTEGSRESPHGDSPRPTWAAARVRKGEGVSYDERGLQGAVAAIDADAAAAWVNGRFEYHGTPLNEVIAKVSRYSAKPIVLQAQAAGQIPFTGSVFQEQIGGWLQALQTVYPIQVEEEPDRFVIRARAPSTRP